MATNQKEPQGMDHVGWQQRYLCPEEGPTIWAFCTEKEAETLKRRTDHQTRKVYAERTPN